MTACDLRQNDTLYEYGALHTTDGHPLRPGGRSLTARAVFCGAWRPGQKVIDIGCGSGGTLDYLRQCGLAAIGVDLASDVLARAKFDDEDRIMVQARGDDLPFADESADGILLECSFSLLASPAKALAEFHRVLRPGGRLVVTDVYARNAQALRRADAHLPTCLSGILEKDLTIRQFSAAGFGVDTWEDHSDVLKTFLGRFIFEYGSLDALWGEATRATKFNWAKTTRELRPGYVLLAARKGKK
jgi:SAM-dependent methyltransferase